VKTKRKVVPAQIMVTPVEIEVVPEQIMVTPRGRSTRENEDRGYTSRDTG